MDPITAVTLDDAVFGINRLERKCKLRRLTAPFALNIKTWKESEGLEGIKKKKAGEDGGGEKSVDYPAIFSAFCHTDGCCRWKLCTVFGGGTKERGAGWRGGIKGNGIQSEGSQGVPLLPPDLPSYHASSSSLLFHPFLSFLSSLSICWSRTPDEGAN